MAGHVIAGVDEAGRGPWAGPVMAAAVAGPVSAAGVTDSKRLTARDRERVGGRVRQAVDAWAIGRVEVAEIDALNIRRATLMAMRRAVDQLAVAVGEVWVDGREVPEGLDCEVYPLVGGDGLDPTIGAASILAKTARDAEMVTLAKDYPGYGFERHKGYGTAEHRSALERLGPCPIHRYSFAPVRRQL